MSMLAPEAGRASVKLRSPEPTIAKNDSSNRKQRSPCKYSEKERIVIRKVVNLSICDGQNGKRGRCGSGDEAEQGVYLRPRCADSVAVPIESIPKPPARAGQDKSQCSKFRESLAWECRVSDLLASYSMLAAR